MWIGDKAYSARAHRARMRSRGVKTVIPEPSDQIRNRKRCGSRGGRPPAFDAETYRGRNVVERSFNTVKQWRGLATRYDSPSSIAAWPSYAPSPSGSSTFRDTASFQGLACAVWDAGWHETGDRQGRGRLGEGSAPLGGGL